jgi:hypothetical protein
VVPVHQHRERFDIALAHLADYVGVGGGHAMNNPEWERKVTSRAGIETQSSERDSRDSGPRRASSAGHPRYVDRRCQHNVWRLGRWRDSEQVVEAWLAAFGSEAHRSRYVDSAAQICRAVRE